MKNNYQISEHIVELSSEELKKVEGGLLPIIVGLVVVGFTLGYNDGRRDKHAEKE